MASENDLLPIEDEHNKKNNQPRVGVDLLTTGQFALEAGVSTRQVERWITKDHNALPALRVTAKELYAMGYVGNLYPSRTGYYYLVKKAHLSLIPTIRKYPTGTKRPGRARRGTLPKPGSAN